MSNHTRYYKAADITIQVNSDYPITDKTFHPKFKTFETQGPGNDTIIINHYFHPINPSYKQETLIYNKDQWQIFKSPDSWFYKYTPFSAEDRGNPVIGKFCKDHSLTEIYAAAIHKDNYQNAQFNALTLFNTDQVLFARLLNNRNGLIIHSNGFNINGRGILLTGNSGAGKSTLSHMLKQKGADILCDDRMFVKFSHTDFWIHGHWNHGSVPDVSSASAPLKAIFFLEQAKNNEIIKLKDKKKVTLDLFQSVVKQFLTQDEWSSTFTILEKIIHDIDCYVIKFNLDGNICEKIIKLLQRYPL